MTQPYADYYFHLQLCILKCADVYHLSRCKNARLTWMWMDNQIIFIFKHSTNYNAQTTEEYHCLVCQEKCMPNALKGYAVK